MDLDGAFVRAVLRRFQDLGGAYPVCRGSAALGVWAVRCHGSQSRAWAHSEFTDGAVARILELQAVFWVPLTWYVTSMEYVNRCLFDNQRRSVLNARNSSGCPW